MIPVNIILLSKVCKFRLHYRRQQNSRRSIRLPPIFLFPPFPSQSSAFPLSKYLKNNLTLSIWWGGSLPGQLIYISLTYLHQWPQFIAGHLVSMETECLFDKVTYWKCTTALVYPYIKVLKLTPRKEWAPSAWSRLTSRLRTRETRKGKRCGHARPRFFTFPIPPPLRRNSWPLSSAHCKPDENTCCLKETKSIIGSSTLIPTHLSLQPMCTQEIARRDKCLPDWVISGCGVKRSNHQSLKVSWGLTPALFPCYYRRKDTIGTYLFTTPLLQPKGVSICLSSPMFSLPMILHMGIVLE